MKRYVVLLPLILGACPSDNGNPPILYLGPKDGEMEVELIDHDPPPF